MAAELKLGKAGCRKNAHTKTFVYIKALILPSPIAKTELCCRAVQVETKHLYPVYPAKTWISRRSAIPAPLQSWACGERSRCGLGSPAFNDLVRQAKTLDEVGLAAIVALAFPNTSFSCFRDNNVLAWVRLARWHKSCEHEHTISSATPH